MTGLPSIPETRELIDVKMFTRDLGLIDKDHKFYDEKVTRIVGIGSSEIEDLAGDRMLESALDDMCKFSVGSAIFMNHDYSVPDSVFGSLSVAPIKYRVNPDHEVGAIKAQSPYWAVEVVADVFEENPAALRTLTAIKKGIRLGYSIGCQVTDYEIRKEDGIAIGIDIAHIRPLEWSVVGIPCNAQSWISGAVKSLRRKGVLPPARSEWAYVLRNYADFASDPLTCIALRNLNDYLERYNLTLAHLPQETAA